MMLTSYFDRMISSLQTYNQLYRLRTLELTLPAERFSITVVILVTLVDIHSVFLHLFSFVYTLPLPLGVQEGVGIILLVPAKCSLFTSPAYSRDHLYKFAPSALELS